MTLLWVLQTFVQYLWIAWWWASIFSRVIRRLPDNPVRPALLVIRCELHPFRWALAIADFALMTALTGPGITPGITLAIMLYGSWYMRKDDDDDDRWKRRRKAAASKVSEIGGRLQVIPASA